MTSGTVLLLLMAPAILAALVASAPMPPPMPPMPYHPFCNTLWLFAAPCPELNAVLVKQIQTFSLMSSCDSCHYQLVAASDMMIKANHTSVDGLKTENITMTFSPTVIPGGCRVTAKSVSDSFYSLLDGGLNYCNLYNLLAASGLTSAPGFMEMTNEWACLGYGLSPCRPSP